jgi:hypothetical protein
VGVVVIKDNQTKKTQAVEKVIETFNNQENTNYSVGLSF